MMYQSRVPAAGGPPPANAAYPPPSRAAPAAATLGGYYSNPVPTDQPQKPPPYYPQPASFVKPVTPLVQSAAAPPAAGSLASLSSSRARPEVSAPGSLSSSRYYAPPTSTPGYPLASAPLQQHPPQQQQQQQPQPQLQQVGGSREVVGVSDRRSSGGPLGTSSTATSAPSSSSSLAAPAAVETLVRSSHSRIDPAFVPRPLFSPEVVTERGGKRYETDKYTVPPPPFGTYTVIDNGNASCRFMRVSLNQFPAASQTLKTCSIPLVVAAQPFPIFGECEEEVNYVNFNRGSELVALDSETEGPPRCSRCRGYLSPFVTFPDNTSALCNFCGYTYSIPRHYQLILFESTRQQSNTPTQPELTKGVVDYAAPKMFLTAVDGQQVQETTTTGRTRAKHTQNAAETNGETVLPTPTFVFAIDTSAAAQQSGFTAVAIDAVKYCCSQIQNPAIKICIFTFDSCLKFYLVKQTPAPQILAVTDVQEPFVPAHASALCVEVVAYRKALEVLFERLPTLIAGSQGSPDAHGTAPPVAPSASCGNAALRAAVSLIGSLGGGAAKVFYGTAPDVGVGAAPKSGPAAVASGAQPRPPLQNAPYLDDFCSEVIGDCVNTGVAVDLFVASASTRQHIGLSNIAYISRKSGGKVHYYGSFDYYKDYQRVCMDVTRQFLIPQGFDCLIKMRISKGFSVSKLLTPGTIGRRESRIDVFTEPSFMRIPRVDADDTLIYVLKSDGEALEDASPVQIQLACLHTTLEGHRRLRVVTLSVPLTNSLSTTFRYAEVETLLAFIVRNAAHVLMTTNPPKWREETVRLVVDILFAYRLNCAVNTSAGQLILPDALKALPAYICGLFKHDAFRTNGVYSDERDFNLSFIVGAPLHQLIPILYPRLYVIHRSKVQVKNEKLQRTGQPVGFEDEVYLPPILPCSGEKITMDGIFLLDCETAFKLYFGTEVDQEIIQQLFGVPELTDEVIQTANAEQLGGPVGETISQCIKQFRKVKGLSHPYQPVDIVRARSIEESKLTWRLVEDRLGSEPSHVDFLCQLHRAVHTKLEDA